MDFLIVLISLAVSYLVGSIPSGYIITKAVKGVDIREVGSGNIGATNVKRALGTKWFFIVLALDALKGYLPVILAKQFFPHLTALPELNAIAAVLGHTFTIFLNFKGGKGVATGLGIFIALAPMASLSCLVLFVFVVWAFGYISLGSILAAFFLPPLVFIYGESGFYLSLVMAAFVIYKHRENIERVENGTESKFQLGKGKK